MKKNIQAILIFAHVFLMAMVFGGAILETFVYTANWFHDIPASLDLAKGALQYRNPGQFFQTFFPLAILTGILFVIIGWNAKAPRNLIIVAIVFAIAIEALTFSMIYPLIGILYRDGSAVHSTSALQQAANKFQTINYVRLSFFFVTEMLSLLGLWKFTKYAVGDDRS